MLVDWGMLSGSRVGYAKSAASFLSLPRFFHSLVRNALLHTLAAGRGDGATTKTTQNMTHRMPTPRSILLRMISISSEDMAGRLAFPGEAPYYHRTICVTKYVSCFTVSSLPETFFSRAVVIKMFIHEFPYSSGGKDDEWLCARYYCFWIGKLCGHLLSPGGSCDDSNIAATARESGLKTE